MLNLIWAGMIFLGVLYATVSGNMQDVSNAIVDSAKDAVNLCITMLGIMSFWCGTIGIANGSGLTKKLTKVIEPFVNWMFPGIKNNYKAKEYISLNIVSNILGMGWAATPAGLSAMKELADHNKKNNHIKDNSEKVHIATDEMCTFLVLNISSLQLIPVNIIAYRSRYGAVNPAAIVAPAILATFFSTIIAIIYCKIKTKK